MKDPSPPGLSSRCFVYKLHKPFVRLLGKLCTHVYNLVKESATAVTLSNTHMHSGGHSNSRVPLELDVLNLFSQKMYPRRAVKTLRKMPCSHFSSWYAVTAIDTQAAMFSLALVDFCNHDKKPLATNQAWLQGSLNPISHIAALRFPI